MTKTTKTIYFDMDGTIADFYGVSGWLTDLENSNVRPYAIAKPLIKMNLLARLLNLLQKKGYKIGVVSWLSKTGTFEYNEQVIATKIKWLNTHLKSVTFNEVKIVPYGTPKSTVVNNCGILFDDEDKNRIEWEKANVYNTAYDVNNIIEILKALTK